MSSRASRLPAPIARRTPRAVIAASTAIAGAAPLATAGAVQWETQADRLQNISATLIDGVPVPHPLKYNNFGLGLQGDISFLPKVNTTVGGKTEKVPQAKFHAVPTLEAQGGLTFAKSYGVGLAAYGGFLPPMPKFVSGIDAKLTQSVFGVLADFSALIGKGVQFFGQGGWHSTSGKVKGKIASKDGGTDSFDVRTTITHLSAGVVHRPSRVWLAYQTGFKKTHSKLYIEEDDTELSLDDALGDATVPLFAQATIGWAPSSLAGFRTALSFLYVPNRVYLPRLTLGFTHFFRQKDAKRETEEGEAESAPEGAGAAPKAMETTPPPAPATGAAGGAEAPQTPAVPPKANTKPAAKPVAKPAAPKER